MGILARSNAKSAKIIGAGTIIGALFALGEWGIISATLIGIAGGALVFGSGKELPQYSARGVLLFAAYWGFLIMGIGAGVA